MASPKHENAKMSFPEFYTTSSNTDHTIFRDYHTLSTDSNENIDVSQQFERTDQRRNDLNDRTRHKINSSEYSDFIRERDQRLDDELEIFKIERVVSNARKSQESTRKPNRTHTSREPIDDFDASTTAMHEKAKLYHSSSHPSSFFTVLLRKIHQSRFLVRCVIYITPIAAIFSIPTFLGLLVFKDARIGGLRLFWLGIWLEIIWLSLWLARIIVKLIPWSLGILSSLVTNNSKKWKNLAEALEVPTTMLFWMIAVEVSLIHIVEKHHINHVSALSTWGKPLNKIILSALVGVILNFFEKFIIQLIAMSFHLRTYADRIEKTALKDSDFELSKKNDCRSPQAYISQAGKNARHVFTKFGDVAGKFAEDFTGQAVKTSTHPQQVVLQLIGTIEGSQILARRLFRTFAQDNKTVFPDDLKPAIEDEEEVQTAFNMFDMDSNGNISMEELEAVCVEIGRERKGITASLKDLDSVVSKLDKVLLFLVVFITILVLLSLISSSASVLLTSAGSTILALSWLLQATAQEFLQSLIFVFVKHPFDVGDRVTIYGNTGKTLTGDDYFVKKISLLYTEFKKMEGHVVQAPNSYLNTVFILNQRRSGSLAEAVPVTVKFGTTLEQIDNLRLRLLEFVKSESREYQNNILTELTTIDEAYSITLNIVFFYKSNWQNELLRLQRRNKFICVLMVTMNELGIEGPRMRLAGASEQFPMHLRGAYPITDNSSSAYGPGPRSGSLAHETPIISGMNSSMNRPSSRPHRDEYTSRGDDSISVVAKRVDLSLGMSAISSGSIIGDVFADREKIRLPPTSKIRSENTTNLEKIISRDSDSSHKIRSHFSLRKKFRQGSIDKNVSINDLEVGSSDFTMPGIAEVKSENALTNTQSPSIQKEINERSK